MSQILDSTPSRFAVEIPDNIIEEVSMLIKKESPEQVGTGYRAHHGDNTVVHLRMPLLQSVEDPDPYWIRIQELSGSVFKIWI